MTDGDTADHAVVGRGESRALVGLACGVGAAAVTVAGWYVASIGTKSELVYLAVAVGVAVGLATNAGARQGSALVAVIAVAVTFVGVVAGYYLVSRASLVRRGFVELPGEGPIPSMPSYTLVRDVLRVNLRGNVAPYLYLCAALVAAGVLGWRGLDPGGRRAER